MCSIELYMFTSFFYTLLLFLIFFSLSLFVVLLVSCSLLSRELIPGLKNLGLTTWAKEAGYCTTGPCMYGNKPCKTQWTHMEVTVSFHKLKHVLCFFCRPSYMHLLPCQKATFCQSYPWLKLQALEICSLLSKLQATPA